MSTTRAHLRSIPRERWQQKLRRAVFGTLLVAGSIAAGLHGWPWYAVLAIGGAGFHTISKDFSIAARNFAVDTIRAVVRALAGKNGANGDGKPHESEDVAA